MIVGSYDDSDILKNTTFFYLNKIAKPYLHKFFNIYFSDNIAEDIKQYNNGRTSDIPTDGVTILPTSSEGLITIFIDKNTPIEVQPQTIFHELCHMHDLLTFAKKYCNGSPYLIRTNKFLSTLRNWSEFHAQFISLPYFYSYLSFLNLVKNDKRDFDKEFRNLIGTYYYDKFNENFLNKEEICDFDIMYYLGEIAMCNQNDPSTFYLIDNRIIEQYPFIEDLYLILNECLTGVSQSL